MFAMVWFAKDAAHGAAQSYVAASQGWGESAVREAQAKA